MAWKTRTFWADVEISSGWYYKGNKVIYKVKTYLDSFGSDQQTESFSVHRRRTLKRWKFPEYLTKNKGLTNLMLERRSFCDLKAIRVELDSITVPTKLLQYSSKEGKGGFLPVNAFYTSKVQIPVGAWSEFISTSGQHDFAEGFIHNAIASGLSIQSVPNTIPWQVEAEAQQKCYKRASTPNGELGPFLGELGKTLLYLKRPLKRLRDMRDKCQRIAAKRVQQAKMYKRKLNMYNAQSASIMRNKYFTVMDRRRAFDRLIKPRRPKFIKKKDDIVTYSNFRYAILDTYLEYRYAVRPLLGDAKSIAKMFANAPFKIPFERHSGKSELLEDWVVVKSGSVRYTNIMVYYEYSTRVYYKCGAGIYCSLTSYALKWWNRQRTMSGLSIERMPYIIWELSWYSFVLDWFLGVGAWLKAVFPSKDKKIIDGWQTTVIRRDNCVKITKVKSLTSGEVIRSYARDLTWSNYRIERKAEIPRNPGFPLIKFSFDFFKALDLFALFRR